jgi:hypothetical protein
VPAQSGDVHTLYSKSGASDGIPRDVPELFCSCKEAGDGRAALFTSYVASRFNTLSTRAKFPESKLEKKVKGPTFVSIRVIVRLCLIKAVFVPFFLRNTAIFYPNRPPYL